MTSKGAKETIVSKLGFKSSSSASKAEAELDRVRKENAHLKKKIDELSKRHIKPPDTDKSKLLEVQERVVLSVTLMGFLFEGLECGAIFSLFVFNDCVVSYVCDLRESFLWRHCGREITSSCWSKSKNWKL